MAIVRPLEPFPNLLKYDWDQPELISWFHRLQFTIEDTVASNNAADAAQGAVSPLAALALDAAGAAAEVVEGPQGPPGPPGVRGPQGVQGPLSFEQIEDGEALSFAGLPNVFT